jgi:hypothetical protein
MDEWSAAMMQVIPISTVTSIVQAPFGDRQAVICKLDGPGRGADERQ